MPNRGMIIDTPRNRNQKVHLTELLLLFDLVKGRTRLITVAGNLNHQRQHRAITQTLRQSLHIQATINHNRPQYKALVHNISMGHRSRVMKANSKATSVLSSHPHHHKVRPPSRP